MNLPGRQNFGGQNSWQLVEQTKLHQSQPTLHEQKKPTQFSVEQTLMCSTLLGDGSESYRCKLTLIVTFK